MHAVDITSRSVFAKQLLLHAADACARVGEEGACRALRKSPVNSASHYTCAFKGLQAAENVVRIAHARVNLDKRHPVSFAFQIVRLAVVALEAIMLTPEGEADLDRWLLAIYERQRELLKKMPSEAQ